LDIFPGGVLGSEAELLEQVRAGAVELMAGGGSIQKYVPEVGVTHLPALFRDYDHFDKVVATPDGPFDKLNQLVADNPEVGLRIFGWSPNGFRNFMHRSDQVESTADLAGVTIRVDDVPTSARIWEAEGANPVPLPFTEVYSALQTGVIDAAEGAFANMLSQKFYEQAPYITVTGHQLALDAFIGNATWWAGLSPSEQEIITAAFADFLTYRNDLAEQTELQGRSDLEALGATVVELSDPEVFRSNLQPIQQEFGEQYGQQAIIDEILNTQ
jgi:TRAP-type C4-dicarboxylate transport system substrate-binding protein